MGPTPIPFVQLPLFEGPLELLLYLIKKEEINIYDIPIAKITEQYLVALDHYVSMNLDIGGDFLVMASTLMMLKSKMLLPADPSEVLDEDGPDPRADLVRQIIEFQMFQEAGDSLRKRDILGVDTFHEPVTPENPGILQLSVEAQPLASVGLYELIKKFREAMLRSKDFVHHVSGEEVSLRKCIETIVERLEETRFLYFSEIVAQRFSLRELIVYFLAILELCKMKFIVVGQPELFGGIRIEKNPTASAIDWNQLSWL